MRTLTYQPADLTSDYLHGGGGVIACGAALAFFYLATPLSLVTWGLLVLFAAFVVQTWLLHRSRIEIDAEAITLHALGTRRIAWTALDRLDLNYYALKRNRPGWLKLTLGTGPTRIAIDSRLDSFEFVVAEAQRAAYANGVILEPTTLANLQGLALKAQPNRM